MPRRVLEPAIPESQQPQTHVSDSAATGICSSVNIDSKERRIWGVETSKSRNTAKSEETCDTFQNKGSCQNCEHPTRYGIYSSDRNIPAWLSISYGILRDRSVAQVVIRSLPLRRPKFIPRPTQVGLHACKVKVEQVLQSVLRVLLFLWFHKFFTLISLLVTGTVTILATDSAFK
jgi:hypothetical protein